MNLQSTALHQYFNLSDFHDSFSHTLLHIFEGKLIRAINLNQLVIDSSTSMF